MKTKREVALEKCLEKTLKDIQVLSKFAEELNCRELTAGQYLTKEWPCRVRVSRRIQRTLGRK